MLEIYIFYIFIFNETYLKFLTFHSFFYQVIEPENWKRNCVDQVHKHLHFLKLIFRWVILHGNTFLLKVKGSIWSFFSMIPIILLFSYFLFIIFLLCTEVNIKLCLLLSWLFVCLFFKCLSEKMIWGLIFPKFIF